MFGRFDPFEELNMITDMFLDFFSEGEKRYFPALNLYQNGDKYEVKVIVPGVKKEDLEIEAVEGSLRIKGERKREEDGNYLRQERTSGEFIKTVNIPENVAIDKISATLKDGILTITMPIKEEAKPKKIEVKAN
jgi:HSP20 family protein